MVQLCTTSRHLILGTTVSNDCTLSAKTLSSTDSVHSNVTATKDNDVLAVLGWGVVLREVVSLHEVNAGEVLVCKEDVWQILARDVEKLWKASAGCNVDCVKALLKELFCIGDTTNNRVELKLNAQLLEAVNLTLNNSLWKTELRNTVDQNAAAGEECLKDGNVKAVTSKLASASNTGRTGAYNCNLLAVLWSDSWLGSKLRLIAKEALELTNSNWFAALTHDADALALVLLWANTTTNCRKHGRLADDVKTAAKLLCTDCLDEARNIDVYRAALNAQWILTIQAAVCLCNCHLFCETLVDRAEVLCALCSWLFVVSCTRCLDVWNVATVYLWHAHLVSS